MSYPLFEDSGINDEGANLTEFEIFCYNIIAECVRIDQNYLTWKTINNVYKEWTIVIQVQAESLLKQGTMH